MTDLLGHKDYETMQTDLINRTIASPIMHTIGFDAFMES